LIPQYAEDRWWARYRGWLLLIALIHTVAGQVAFSHMNPDKVALIAAARSLLDRGQLTLAVVDPGRPLDEVGAPVGWPHGYSVVIAALLKVTGDIWLSTIVLDAVMAGICTIAWFVIIERAGSMVSPGARIQIWLWWGLLFGPAMAPLPSSDLAWGWPPSLADADLWEFQLTPGQIPSLVAPRGAALAGSERQHRCGAGSAEP
jgi:hypothetical protein